MYPVLTCFCLGQYDTCVTMNKVLSKAINIVEFCLLKMNKSIKIDLLCFACSGQLAVKAWGDFS